MKFNLNAFSGFIEEPCSMTDKHPYVTFWLRLRVFPEKGREFIITWDVQVDIPGTRGSDPIFQYFNPYYTIITSFIVKSIDVR
jgi:hypothetical protein